MFEHVREDRDIDRRIGKRHTVIQVALVKLIVTGGLETGTVSDDVESDPTGVFDRQNEAFDYSRVAPDVNDHGRMVEPLRLFMNDKI